VNSECDALLIRAVGKVQLGLDHPQPIVGLRRVFGVAKGRGLQADEPLDLALEALFRRALTVGPVVPLLNCLSQALEQLSLPIHDLGEGRRWWWLVRGFGVEFLIDILLFGFFFTVCQPKDVGCDTCDRSPTSSTSRCRGTCWGDTPTSTAKLTASSACLGCGLILSGLLEKRALKQSDLRIDISCIR
jgi:hypothetical protein